MYLQKDSPRQLIRGIANPSYPAAATAPDDEPVYEIPESVVAPYPGTIQCVLHDNYILTTSSSQF